MTAEDLTDWLETTIDDSFDLGWTSRDAATLIVSRMQSEGLVPIDRDGMRERVAKALYEQDDVWHKAWPWPDLQETQGSPDAYRDLADAAIAAILGGEHE